MEAAPKAQADPERPVYHFLPPARWMNDINGPLHYKGHYHIFYQFNPFGDKPYNEAVTDHVEWAGMHWGHARSRDLVSWEHLPIALAPSRERGCWSGCAAVNETGAPMLFYTAVFENKIPYQIPFEQWAAICDEDMIEWKRSPANPILTLKTHGRPGFSPEWRDPFIFRTDGRTFMLIGACGDAGTPIYEAGNADLTEWTCRGIMWNKSVECPNFVSLGDKWVFISSPFDSVRYDVGTFDTRTLTFTPESGGVVDWGNYYGTNTMFDKRGRCILFGWVPGWDWDALKDGRGWNGCMALPRILSLTADNRLVQTPAPELKKLRMGEGRVHTAMKLSNSSHVIEDAGDTLEIVAELAPGEARSFGLKMRRSSDGARAVEIRCDRDKDILQVAGTEIPMRLDSKSPLKLHVFLDKSIMELYANDGETVITKAISPAPTDQGLELFSLGGAVEVKSLDIWNVSQVS
ncbi:MAG: glycoside hydrolase family 32 protein [Candidatus Abyssubacteria bacterium]